MPIMNIVTNKQLDHDAIKNFNQKASKLVSEITGKPEKWVMVLLQESVPMIFNASSDAAALITLGSIGLNTDSCSDLSHKICHFIEDEMGIPSERVYIQFSSLEKQAVGWNGSTF